MERRSLSLAAVNHISILCHDVEASLRFYSEVLGFHSVKRPSSFEFEGAWLDNYGIGLHLIKGSPTPRSQKINPKASHISFQANSLEDVESCLQSWGVEYVKQVFLEDGIQISQMFFHDPDNNMIEVCNCAAFPVVPLTEAALACSSRPLGPARAQAHGADVATAVAARRSHSGGSDAGTGSSDEDHMSSDHSVTSEAGGRSSPSCVSCLSGESATSGISLFVDAFSRGCSVSAAAAAPEARAEWGCGGEDAAGCLGALTKPPLIRQLSTAPAEAF